MNLNLIYFSPTGGTKKTLEILGDTWDSHKNYIDISLPDVDYKSYSFSSDEIYIIWVPSFGRRVPEVALNHINQMKSNNSPTIILATFGNRNYDDTLLELKTNAENCGFKVIAAIASVYEHSIIHQFDTGRPNNDDINEIHEFGEKIRELLSSDHNSSNLKVPRNEPYREYSGLPLKPKTTKNCPKCGLCANTCSTKVIPLYDPTKTDSNACISCMRCISICPNHARALNKFLLFIASKKMEKSCSSHKKIERFI